MTVSLRNTSGEPLNLGSSGGRRVDADEVVHVEGDLDKSSPDDAYVIAGQAWPKSTWTNVGGPKNATPDVEAPST